jgi:hypothetical protein
LWALSTMRMGWQLAASLGTQAGNLAFDLAVERGPTALGGQAHLPSDGFVQIHHVAGGEGHEDDTAKARVQGGHHLATGAGFTATTARSVRSICVTLRRLAGSFVIHRRWPRGTGQRWIA